MRSSLWLPLSLARKLCAGGNSELMPLSLCLPLHCESCRRT